MGWNYRVLRRLYEMPDGRHEAQFAIYEVYYDHDGRPNACSMEPLYPAGESMEELRRDVAAYVAALDLPVLDYEAIGNA